MEGDSGDVAAVSGFYDDHCPGGSQANRYLTTGWGQMKRRAGEVVIDGLNRLSAIVQNHLKHCQEASQNEQDLMSI